MTEPTGFERRARLCVAVAFAAMIAACAIGQVRAQPVNPPIVLPPPTFNPSYPNTVPQPPPTPVPPGVPSGLGLGAAPASPVILPPPSVRRQRTDVPRTAKPVRRHARHHAAARARRHRSNVRVRRARVLGPSYYPGLGEIYPPYADPCHIRPVWSGYFAGQWATYTCSW